MKRERITDEMAYEAALHLKRYCGQHRSGCMECVFRRKSSSVFKGTCKLNDVPVSYNLTHCLELNREEELRRKNDD